MYAGYTRGSKVAIKCLKGEGHAKINNYFLHKYTLWHMSLTVKSLKFLPLPFAQETIFFSAFLLYMASTAEAKILL